MAALVHGKKAAAKWFKPMWHFYLDESGQDAHQTPCVVVDGFGIEQNSAQEFIDRIKAIFEDCYGFPLDEYYELKGSKLLNVKKLKRAKAWEKKLKYEFHNDQKVTHHHVGRAMARFPQGELDANDLNAQAYVGVVFVKKILLAFIHLNCKIFIEYHTQEQYYHSVKELKLINREIKYMDFILEALESELFNKILNFIEDNNKNGLVFYDKAGEKTDYQREGNILGELEYLKTFKNYQSNITFRTIDSKDSILIQIADIILYVVNWGILKDNNREDIRNILLKNKLLTKNQQINQKTPRKIYS